MHKSERICTDRQNYNAVDLAKFTCSILVVVIHVTPFAGATGPVAAELNFLIQHCVARVAVPFFFIMSAYFLYGKTSLTAFDPAPTKKFALRMLRLYLIWTVIYAPLMLGSYLRSGERIVSIAAHYIRDVIFVGGYYHLWFLNALIVGAVIVTILLRRGVKPRTMLLVAFLLYFCGLFSKSWFGFLLPLKDRIPILWTALRQVKKVIVTTNNGLFEGFLFVAMGMWLAFYGVRVSKGRAFAAFVIFMAVMTAEQRILNALHFVREDDMFLFLVPASFFLCAFVLQLALPDSPVYRHLRMLSSLIYYIHLWVKEIVFALLKLLWAPLIDTWLPFALTLLLSILVSEIIIVVSQRPKCAWVKRLYC